MPKVRSDGAIDYGCTEDQKSDWRCVTSDLTCDTSEDEQKNAQNLAGEAAEMEVAAHRLKMVNKREALTMLRSGNHWGFVRNGQRSTMGMVPAGCQCLLQEAKRRTVWMGWLDPMNRSSAAVHLDQSTSPARRWNYVEFLMTLQAEVDVAPHLSAVARALRKERHEIDNTR